MAAEYKVETTVEAHKIIQLLTLKGTGQHSDEFIDDEDNQRALALGL